MLLAPLHGGSQVIMSYQYPPYPADYSNHSTPPSFWEQQAQNIMDASPGSTSISPEVFQQQLSPVDSPISLDHHHHQQPLQQASPSYEPLPTIQIQERVQPSQFRFENIDESHFLPQQEDGTEVRQEPSGKAVSRASEEVCQSTSPSSTGAGPSRVPHGKAHIQSHPYRRTSAVKPTVDASLRSAGTRTTSSSARGQRRDSEELGERSSRVRGDVPPMVGSRAALSCPAGATHVWRLSSHTSAESAEKSVVHQGFSGDALHVTNTSYEDQATSPMAQVSTEVPTPSVRTAQLVPPVIPQPRRNKMLITADVHFDATTNEMTAVFELPGLKKCDLTIRMQICPYSGVRQVTIMGRRRPIFPQGVYTVQERKFGDFYRTVVVPLDTKPEDVIAKMEDGILTLKVPCGTLAQEREEPHDISIQ